MSKVFDFLIICFYAALGYLIWLELRDIRKKMK